MGKSFLCPGFRFNPTDVELVMYFLKRKLLGKKLIIEAVSEVNIYDFSPWDLPDKSNLRYGDLEWFFFCSKSRKYSSGSRINRATATGFWKATGKDRTVEYRHKVVARIKTLVFHLGHPSKGQRTDWVMHEYRMDDEDLVKAGAVQDAYVLCKLFQKSGAGPKRGAQYGAPFNEEEWDDDEVSCSESSPDFGLSRATNTLDPNANSSAVTTMTLRDPGPSAITSSANERHVDVPANDDARLINEDITSILNGNNTTQEVEDPRGKKVMTATSNEEDDCVYKDLASLTNLDDFNEGALNLFTIDKSDYTLDEFPTTDDLDVDLGKFFVD